MTPRWPDAWQFVLLALAVFRLVRLVGWDTISIGLRGWLTGISDAEHVRYVELVSRAEQEGIDPWRHGIPRDYTSPGARGDDPLPFSRTRFHAALLIRCPWCVSPYVALVVYLLWLWQPRVTLAVSSVLAISSVVGLVAKNLDP